MLQISMNFNTAKLLREIDKIQYCYTQNSMVLKTKKNKTKTDNRKRLCNCKSKKNCPVGNKCCS